MRINVEKHKNCAVPVFLLYLYFRVSFSVNQFAITLAPSNPILLIGLDVQQVSCFLEHVASSYTVHVINALVLSFP